MLMGKGRLWILIAKTLTSQLYNSEFLFVLHLELEVLLKCRGASCLALSNSIPLGHEIWLRLHYQADIKSGFF